MQINTVVALSPHTDDGELGAGGLLSRLAQQGKEVRYIAFSRAKSLTPGHDSLAECRASAARLGVTAVEFWDYPSAHLLTYRQEILERFIALRDRGLPDLVLVPARYDCHQDHQCVTQEAVRAFKRTSLLGYDLPWNAVGDSRLDLYVPLTTTEVEAKEAALAEYQSQQGRPFFQPGIARAIARVRGEQCGVEYAEAFECIRFLW